MEASEPKTFMLSDLMGFLKSEGFLIYDIPYDDVQLCGFSRVSDPLPDTVTWSEGTSLDVARYKSVVVLCGEEVRVPKSFDGFYILVKEPRRAFAKSMTRFGVHEAENASGIAQTARIADDCLIGRGSSVGEYSVIEAGVTIGESTRIGNHVCIKSRACIGSHCLIRSGVVIGGVGFGFCEEPDGRWERFPHLGSIVIEDHVEIGANSVIDRS